MDYTVVGKCSEKSLSSKIFSWKEPFEVGKVEISWKDFVVVKYIVVGKIHFGEELRFKNRVWG